MLEHLEIKNFALIENLSVDFSDGFNVITGETGAGKSIILGALGILMGEKADASSIRTGAEEMVVNAVISVPENHELRKWFNDREIELEDNTIIVRRTVKANGRSVINVQGQIVSRSELAQIADSLIDMHGQSEHQSLLIQDNQRKIVDSYAHNDSLLEECRRKHSRITELQNKLNELQKKAEEYKQQQDWLEFSVREIEGASIKPAEDEELKSKIDILANFETIYENLDSGIQVLKQIRPLFFDVSSAVKKAAKCDTKLSEAISRLESCRIETDDIAEELTHYLNSVDYSEDAVNQMQDRLALLQKLKRKYGTTLEDVMNFCEDAKQKLSITENSDLLISDCMAELEKTKHEYCETATQLSEKRRESASSLEKKIVQVLRTLGMPNAEFRINVIADKQKETQNGFDVVSFLICANPGEELREMREIASGGELSRVMLALKTVLAKADSIQTQVFDEVDAGIGGSVALSLADCIEDLSKQKQVIVITHLATVASKADRHFTVIKTVENGRTYSRLHRIEGEERVGEIARMLSGDSETVTLEHARKMLEAR